MLFEILILIVPTNIAIWYVLKSKFRLSKSELTFVLLTSIILGITTLGINRQANQRSFFDNRDDPAALVGNCRESYSEKTCNYAVNYYGFPLPSIKAVYSNNERTGEPYYSVLTTAHRLRGLSFVLNSVVFVVTGMLLVAVKRVMVYRNQ